MQTVTVQRQEPRRESATAQEACADSARGQCTSVRYTVFNNVNNNSDGQHLTTLSLLLLANLIVVCC